MTDDVILNKTATIARCLIRIREEFLGHEDELENNFTRQDAITLNLLRACEASIDLAMHLVKTRHLGVPQSSRDAFELLAVQNLIDKNTAEAMKRMVGFRNIAVHQYQQLDTAVLRSILTLRLQDFESFTSQLLLSPAT